MEGSFSVAGSAKEVEEPSLSAAQASGLSFTARASPIIDIFGSDLCRESESLRQRRLG